MRRLKLALAIATAIAAGSAAAADETVAFYELCVNGRCAGAATVVVDAAGEAWIDAAALEPFALDTTAWAARADDGTRMVAARALPGATVSIDAARLRLDLSLPGIAWHEREYAARPPRARSDAATAVTTASSTYLDYTVQGGLGRAPSAFGEVGWVRGDWLVHSTFSLDRAGLARGLTSIEFDRAQRRQRWILGDQVLAPGDAFGGAGVLTGIGVASAWELDPGFVAFPGADVRGVMQAPGTVEVYANGVLVSRQDVGPGPFALRDLALAQGRNDLRIVVDDPFAGRREIESGYYASTQLLGRGLHEYAYRAGRLRRDGDADDGVLLSAWHRAGVTDWLTVGARYERLGDRDNAGLALDLRLPVGSVSLAVARTDGDDGAAWAQQLDYAWQTPRFSLAVGGRRQDADYRALLASGTTRSDASVGDRHASFSLNLTQHATLGARWYRQDFADGARSTQGALRVGLRLGRRAQATLEVGRRRERDGAWEPTTQLSLYVPVGDRGVSVSAMRVGDGATDVQLGMQQPLPAFGEPWSLRTESGWRRDRALASATLEAALAPGRLELVAGRGQERELAARFTGALVHAGGRWHAVPIATNGHALVRTPGQAGVPILRENQRVGATDGAGQLFVSGLLPYQDNLLAIDARALDVGLQPERTEMRVAVGRHAVAFVDFPLRRLTALQAFLAADGKRLALGTVQWTHDGQMQRTRLGNDGQAYLEGLAPGPHVLRATAASGIDYDCAIDVPAGEAMAWLGEVACVPH